MSKDMDVDRADVVAEVTAAFERYEQALSVGWVKAPGTGNGVAKT